MNTERMPELFQAIEQRIPGNGPGSGDGTYDPEGQAKSGDKGSKKSTPTIGEQPAV